MKRRKFGFSLMIFACASVMALSSCEKDDPEPEDPAPVTPTPEANAFFAHLNGAEYVETTYTGMQSSGTILITAGRNGGMESIGLAIPDTISVGSYNFEGSFGNLRGMYNANQTLDGMYSAENNTGSLVITKHDKENDAIKGTFSFMATPNFGSTATDEYSITSGSFVYNY